MRLYETLHAARESQFGRALYILIVLYTWFSSFPTSLKHIKTIKILMCENE